MKESYDDLDQIKTNFKMPTADGERTVAYVFNKTNGYVIYEIRETGQISYKTVNGYPDNTSTIALKLDKVESYLDSDRLLWSKYRNTMADVYYTCLEPGKQTKVAEDLLDAIIPELELQIYGYSKIYYLIPCAFTVFIAVLISVIVKSYNSLAFNHFTSMPFIDVEILSIIYTVTFGGIGGLFSVAIGIDKHQEKISSRVKWGAHSFAGVFRILIAMLSGLILFIILRSKIISFGFVKNSVGDYESHIYYVLALVAGFSQNFIPNLIRKVEDTVAPDKPDTTSNSVNVTQVITNPTNNDKAGS